LAGELWETGIRIIFLLKGLYLYDSNSDRDLMIMKSFGTAGDDIQSIRLKVVGTNRKFHRSLLWAAASRLRA